VIYNQDLIKFDVIERVVKIKRDSEIYWLITYYRLPISGKKLFLHHRIGKVDIKLSEKFSEGEILIIDI
jgi:hypothetical protein